MPERIYRGVDIDLDDLADAIVAWFEHDEFEVQDFQEGPSIFIQARKESLLTKVSFTSQALNVRLSPLARGFKIEVGAGEWLEKGLGAGAAAVALRLFNPLIAVGTAAATGYGAYQQYKLPEQLLAFVGTYVDRNGVRLEPTAAEAERERELELRSPRRSSRPEERSIDEELEDLRAESRQIGRDVVERGIETGRDIIERGREAIFGRSSQPVDNTVACPECGTRNRRDSNFCSNCGARLGGAARGDDSLEGEGREIDPGPESS